MITFTVDGDEYTFAPTGPLRWAAHRDRTANGTEALAWLADGLPPDQWARLAARLTDPADPLDVDLVGKIIGDLVAEAGATLDADPAPAGVRAVGWG